MPRPRRTSARQPGHRRRRRVHRLHATLSVTAALAAAAAAVLLAVVLPAGGAVGHHARDGRGKLAAATRARYVPADQKAAPATVNELNYLGNLPVTGQFLAGYPGGRASDGPGVSGYQDLAGLFHVSGRYPGLTACDYGGFTKPESPTHVSESNCDSYLLGYVRQGGVTEVGFHPGNPAGGRYAAGMSTSQVRALLKHGTASYVSWHNQLNQVAAGLNRLGSHGVTVIFRPLTEMNVTGRGWSWWNGGGWTAASYVALWRDMFKSVTCKLKYHNVLWDWSPGQGASAPARYYPGPGYVDITGLDVRPAGRSSPP